MKKYIRICACCDNTFETDIPANTRELYNCFTENNIHASLCLPHRKAYEAGEIKECDIKGGGIVKRALLLSKRFSIEV